MDIRQLKYFLAIAEEGNITKASEHFVHGTATAFQATKVNGK